MENQKIFIFKTKNDNLLYGSLFTIDYTKENIDKFIKENNVEKYTFVTIEEWENYNNTFPFGFTRIWNDTVKNKMSFDIEEIKNNIKNEWRTKRISILEKLDVQYIIALENNNEELKNEIVKKKNQLRDITNIDLPNNIELLKNFPLPEILNF
jgi:hypothetical protein